MHRPCPPAPARLCCPWRGDGRWRGPRLPALGATQAQRLLCQRERGRQRRRGRPAGRPAGVGASAGAARGRRGRRAQRRQHAGRQRGQQRRRPLQQRGLHARQRAARVGGPRPLPYQGVSRRRIHCRRRPVRRAGPAAGGCGSGAAAGRRGARRGARRAQDGSLGKGQAQRPGVRAVPRAQRQRLLQTRQARRAGGARLRGHLRRRPKAGRGRAPGRRGGACQGRAGCAAARWLSSQAPQRL